MYKQPTDLHKQTKQSKPNNTQAAHVNHKPILKSHSFEQPTSIFCIPEALHLPQLDIPTCEPRKAMFIESKIKKFFNDSSTHAYADSGTDIHITNPHTTHKLGLLLHPYTTPVTIQFGDGSLQSSTHFVFMGDILG